MNIRKINKFIVALITILIVFPLYSETTDSNQREKPKDWREFQWASLKTAVQEKKLLADDGAHGDFFGHSVSLNGNRALVGAYARDDSGVNAGAAYVFDFDGSNWVQSARLNASDPAMNDFFGFSVSLYDDRAVIGAYGDDNENGGNSGSAYVFEYDGTNWNETKKLIPSDGRIGDFFGHSVSLQQDRVLVGSHFSYNDTVRTGGAYVFDYNGIDWIESDKLMASDGASNDRFGFSVSQNGNRVLVGSLYDDDNGTDSGSAYIFDYDGSNWSETTKLKPGNGAEDDNFGFTVSLWGDRALIGAYFDGLDSIDSTGAAYIFDYDGSNWSETTELTPLSPEFDSGFGISVSLSEDRALVGAIDEYDGVLKTGSAYVFAHSNGNWSESDKLLANPGTVNSEFGFSVSLADKKALIGARAYQDNGDLLGAAYLFLVNEIIFAEGFDAPEINAPSNDLH